MKTYFKTLWEDPAAARKAFVALIGAVLQVLLLVVPNAPWLPVVIAVATALGVYSVHNKRKKVKVNG